MIPQNTVQLINIQSTLMKHSIHSIVALLFITACTKPTAVDGILNCSNIDHTIPTEVAVNTLLEYLQQNTKSSPITSYEVNVVLSRQTKTNDSDSLLYLVNFEKESGFAILSADDRISTPILAVTDKGSISVDDFHVNSVFDDYPLTGPGLIYNVDSTECIINPNTFELYSAEIDDYCIGDYIIPSNNNDSTLVNNPRITPIIAELSIEYAENEIKSNNNFTPIKNIDTYDLDSNTRKNTSKVVTSKTSTEIVVPPLLVAINDWGQKGVFNLLTPVSGGVNTPCGCVPLAVSRIMTFWQYPDEYIYNSTRVDWANINTSFYLITDSISASTLTRSIGSFCGSIYTSDGTFTFPSLAANFLKSMLYPNVRYSDYSNSSVKHSLDSGCPLFICSLPKNGFLRYNFQKCHAWNIDGYKYYTTNTNIKYYENHELINEVNTVSKTMMVHCDFGWSSIGNGYYVSGLFDLTRNDLDLDNGMHNVPSYYQSNYNFYLKTITYERPR